jgi:hypothetical protein
MNDERSQSRRDSRVQTDVQCNLVHALGDICSATLLDISRRGFRLRLSDPPEVGDVITLLVDGDDYRSQIVWVMRDEAGGIFLDQAPT